MCNYPVNPLSPPGERVRVRGIFVLRWCPERGMGVLLEVSRSGYCDWVDRPPSKCESTHGEILAIIEKNS